MTRLTFAPVIALEWLAVLAVLALLITAYGLYMRARGAWARGLAFGVLLFALAGPLLVKEQHAPLPDVAVIVTDRSQSMNLGKRARQAEAARAAIRRMLDAQPELVVRETSVTTTATGENNGTQAFAALNAALADVPQGRVAGVVLITDGQVHDAPPPQNLALKAPLQVLVAGGRGERDRKLTVMNAARFAIVGQWALMRLRIDDLGSTATGDSAVLDIRIDGKPFGTRLVAVGKDTDIRVPVAHEGENLVELSAAPGPAELSLQNNHAVVTVSGVRDRLRVLLVSGEPHAGERVWRNLLKADPSVDLIHFTILRPPDKQDTTPLNELSLIAFPYRELFLEKLGSFDLVIFDRYTERGILPLAYFQNLASYVQDGGALLISSGPEFAGPESIFRTPLSQVLPAQPTGQIFTGGFKPMVTADGMAHPVTRELPGRNQDKTPPSWGRWFRTIGSNKIAGHTVMTDAAGHPLLVLDQVGKGRVAELMSDQTWLWARGFEGGGPQAELLRRLAHWLMKEPELEAEKLSADIVGGDIRIIRRTMAATTPPVTLTLPSGKQVPVALTHAEPGIWRGTAKAGELGLYRATDGILSTVTAAGPLNPKEVADMRATEEVLKPLAEASGGSVHWLEDGLPQIRRVGLGDRASGSNWIGLRSNGAYRVTALEQEKLLPQWLALLLIVGALLLAWRLEGR
ncbi:MAG TPA: hypothetical protein VG821_02120 [Rhizomicrobium sp.]|jgi:uncharacterized membrane protein|nr:hypothetical protein [Rhizomicrobium sp.]